jgi:hypothetical protein
MHCWDQQRGTSDRQTVHIETQEEMWSRAAYTLLIEGNKDSLS